MADIKKEELKSIVLVTAHNLNELSDQAQIGINAFDPDTYRRFLGIALARREHADRTNELGGGTRSTAYLKEAIENLEYILSH